MAKTKIEKESWFPYGAYEIPMRFTISTEQINSILKLIGDKKPPNGEKFFKEINRIVNSYNAGKQFEVHGKPSSVKRQLKDLSKKADQLLGLFNKLDGTAWKLLVDEGRGPNYKTVIPKEMPDGSISVGHYYQNHPGIEINMAHIAVAYIIGHAHSVLNKIDEQYDISITPRDRQRNALAKSTALALRDILHVQLTAADDGTYSKVLREVMDFARIPTRGNKKTAPKSSQPFCNPARDVRTLVKLALNEIDTNPRSDNPS